MFRHGRHLQLCQQAGRNHQRAADHAGASETTWRIARVRAPGHASGRSALRRGARGFRLDAAACRLDAFIQHQRALGQLVDLVHQALADSLPIFSARRTRGRGPLEMLGHQPGRGMGQRAAFDAGAQPILVQQRFDFGQILGRQGLQSRCGAQPANSFAVGRCAENWSRRETTRLGFALAFAHRMVDQQQQTRLGALIAGIEQHGALLTRAAALPGHVDDRLPSADGPDAPGRPSGLPSKWMSPFSKQTRSYVVAPACAVSADEAVALAERGRNMRHFVAPASRAGTRPPLLEGFRKKPG